MRKRIIKQEPILIYWCSHCSMDYGVIKYAFDNERCPTCQQIGKEKKNE